LPVSSFLLSGSGKSLRKALWLVKRFDQRKCAFVLSVTRSSDTDLGEGLIDELKRIVAK
jgi:hypothetical protein